ncbi:MAG TPA: YiiD C-terminal domain-containing protein [Gammaproteobacteria bacterium]
MNEAAELERYMHAHIPLVAQMQVKVAGFDAGGLRLTAPLAPNINHERTAFGGSLASLMTLACWGYLWLSLRGEMPLHIVVNEAKVSYLKPVNGTLDALCPPPDAAALEKFRQLLARRGKSRIELAAEVRQDGAVAARYLGSFAVYRDSV